MATTRTSPTPAEASTTSTTPEAGAANVATEGTVSAATTTDSERELTADEKFLAEQESKRPALNELQGVKYVGRSHVRSISKEEFASVGVEAPKDFESAVWDEGNGYVVPVRQLNSAVVDYLNADAEFELV